MSFPNWRWNGAFRVTVARDTLEARPAPLVLESLRDRFRRSPTRNPAEAVAEATRDGLDHFVICGEAHLRYLVNEFVAHCNHERPHQAKGNVPLPDADEDEPRI